MTNPISRTTAFSRLPLSADRLTILRDFAKQEHKGDNHAEFRALERRLTQMGGWDRFQDYFCGRNKEKTLRALADNLIAAQPGGLEYLRREGRLERLGENSRHLLAALTSGARAKLLQTAPPCLTPGSS